MSQPISVYSGGLRWLVLPEWRDRLFGPAGLRLAEWQQTGLAHPVKDGPQRGVFYVGLAGAECYVKHNRLANLRAWLRELLRPAKSLIEYNQARRVAERGVPTVEPVAVGTRARWQGPGESYLVTLPLRDCVPLWTFLAQQLPLLSPGSQTRLRQRLAIELGQFVARLHDAGVIHHDFHLGNVLFRYGADGQLEFFLIDLHTVRLGPPLGWAASRDNLAVFNGWFIGRASRSDRLRFFRSYAECRWPSMQPDELDRRGHELDQAAWNSALRFWRHRDARTLRSSRYFRRLRGPVADGLAVRELNGGLVARLLANPDAPFEEPGARLLKSSRSGTVAELDISIGGAARTVIYKRFRLTASTDALTSLVRRPAALRSWIMGHGLHACSLPTPRPLLVLHRRRHGLYREGYLLMDKVADAVDLHAAVARLFDLPPADGRCRIRALIDYLAHLVLDLHERRLANRDLKAANILVQGPLDNVAGSNNRYGPLWLIDLVGVARYRGPIPRKICVQNIARLHTSFRNHPQLTRTDKLRFLRTYLQWGIRGRVDWKSWWYQIERATAAKVARNARNSRPLS